MSLSNNKLSYLNDRFEICSHWRSPRREILREILYRLGLKTLFRFKCVSKLWNSVISDPKFRQIYLQRSRSSPKSSWSPCHLSAVLYPNVNCRGVRVPPHELPNDSRDFDSASIVQDIDDDVPPSLYVTSFKKPEFAYRIMASSNGLILSLLTPQQNPCNEAQDEFEWEHHFCVSNLLTGHSVKLPTLRITDRYTWAYGLATRAPQPEVGTQDWVTYKVVLFHIFVGSAGFVQIDTFSSDTGRWTRKELMSRPGVVSYGASSRAISYKGILHFFDWYKWTVLTYDPYDSPDQFGSIKLPSGAGKKAMKSSAFNLIRLGHEELLEFGEIEDCGNGAWGLFVWRLVNYDKIEWCLKKKCPISPLWGVLSICKLRLLVAPESLNDEFFCCFLANSNKIVFYNLVTAEKVSFGPFEIQEEPTYFGSRLLNELIPVTLNPWSSPFHGEAGRSSSSQPAGYRKIIPAACFPSFSK